MALPQEKHYTYADLLSWDDEVRYELYDGIPVALASPSFEHQRICRELLRQLANYALGRPCEVVQAPLDVRLFEQDGDSPDDVDIVVQPDLLAVCDKSRIDRRGVRGAPDLVVEILSDSNRRNDQLVKYRWYQKAGVREYWIVDPVEKIVLIHTLEDGQYSSPNAYGASSTAPVGITEDCTVDLSLVFSGG